MCNFRQKNHLTTLSKDTSVQSLPTKGRQYISVHTKRALLEKARNRCEYQDPKTQQKCGSKYKLEIDHRHPVALGGTNNIKNLRVLCQAHNALEARKMGLSYMTDKH
jgi:5-methylcytosine-specific restriction endonuclease McrA